MSSIEEAIDKHIEHCEKELPYKYVTWVWLAGILLAIAMVIGGGTWAMSTQLGDTKNISINTKEKVDGLEKKVASLEEIQKQQSEISIDIKWIRSNMENKHDIK